MSGQVLSILELESRESYSADNSCSFIIIHEANVWIAYYFDLFCVSCLVLIG